MNEIMFINKFEDRTDFSGNRFEWNQTMRGTGLRNPIFELKWVSSGITGMEGAGGGLNQAHRCLIV